VLKVTPGLAINLEGEPLVVCDPQQVELIAAGGGKDGSKQIFDLCDVQPSPLHIPNGIGFYVLAIAPASGFEGQAPKSGLGEQGVAAGCGRRYATLGVQFRLVRLDPLSVSGVDEATKTEIASLAVSAAIASQSRLRNTLAHLCLGTPETSFFPRDPFALYEGAAPWLGYGALDDLRTAKSLLDCDVPLALLSWTHTGLGFLDMWAVRRRVVRGHASREWPLVAADRRRAEAEASFFQFERQLGDLLHSDDIDPETMKATDFFRYLPAAGLLRIATTVHDGFNATTFFQGLNVNGPHALQGPRLLPLLDVSHLHRPIDLSGDAPLLFRYTVVENQADGAARKYEVFTSGWVPLQGAPTFEPDTNDALADLQKEVEDLQAAQPVLATSQIWGYVKLAPTMPLGGGSVTVKHVASGQTVTLTTSESGRFEAKDLAAGTYDVGVNVPGHVATTQTVTVGVGQGKQLDFMLISTSGTVVGIVMTEAGEPVPNATVKVINNATRQEVTIKTGADGSYTASNLVAGDYTVTVSKGNKKIELENEVQSSSTKYMPIVFQ
jgi:hypothetical protein